MYIHSYVTDDAQHKQDNDKDASKYDNHQQQQQQQQQLHHNKNDNYSVDVDGNTIVDVNDISSNEIKLLYFIHKLWSGITVKVIYSNSPIIEKERILYIRTISDDVMNKYINEYINKLNTILLYSSSLSSTSSSSIRSSSSSSRIVHCDRSNHRNANDNVNKSKQNKKLEYNYNILLHYFSSTLLNLSNSFDRGSNIIRDHKSYQSSSNIINNNNYQGNNNSNNNNNNNNNNISSNNNNINSNNNSIITKLLYLLSTDKLCICWTRYKQNLLYIPDKSIRVEAISSIKVGTGL